MTVNVKQPDDRYDGAKWHPHADLNRSSAPGWGAPAPLSLHEALQWLGFAPCEHITNCFAHPERFAFWLEAVRRKRAGEPIDWRQLLAECTRCARD